MKSMVKARKRSGHRKSVIGGRRMEGGGRLRKNGVETGKKGWIQEEYGRCKGERGGGIGKVW